MSTLFYLHPFKFINLTVPGSQFVRKTKKTGRARKNPRSLRSLVLIDWELAIQQVTLKSPPTWSSKINASHLICTFYGFHEILELRYFSSICRRFSLMTTVASPYNFATDNKPSILWRLLVKIIHDFISMPQGSSGYKNPRWRQSLRQDFTESGEDPGDELRLAKAKRGSNTV